MKSMISRVLGTLILVAGIPLALTAQQEQADPLRYEDTIRQWEAQDAANPPPEQAIVITGSSSITRWNEQMAEDLAPLTVIPRGFGGSRMSDVRHYVDRLILAYNPRAVVIYEGDNDTGADLLKAETIIGHFEAIVERIHEVLPETRIYAVSVKPSVARWDVWPEAQRVNERLQGIAARNRLVHYVDVASEMLQPNGDVMPDIFVDDNLHLNDKGTDIWASAIRGALMRIEAEYEPTP